MADEGIKKARVLNKDLPPVLSDLNGYLVRYRIKSADQNRVSHWSPFVFIDPEYTYVPGSVGHTSANQILSVTWDSVNILKSGTSVTNITNKSLNNDVATITTSAAHYLNIGDFVTVSGVDSTFNGTHIVTAVTTTPSHTFSFYKDAANVSLTAVSPNGTYTKNNYIAKENEYDIWIRWDRNDSGDWIYKERLQGTGISFPHPSFYTINGAVQSQPPNRVSVEIYIIGNPPARGDGNVGDTGTPPLKVYQFLNQTI